MARLDGHGVPHHVLTHLALVTMQILIAAEAEPVGLGDSGILRVLVRARYSLINCGQLLLVVRQTLLDIIFISFLAQEQIYLGNLIIEGGKVLLDVGLSPTRLLL